MNGHATHRLESENDGSQKRRYTVTNAPDLRDAVHHLFAKALDHLDAGRMVELVLRDGSMMSWEQQQRLNAMCGDLAEQVKWMVTQHDGSVIEELIGKDDWRHFFVAAHRQDSRTVAGLHGGLVVLGGSSKDLGKRECAAVIDLIQSFGDSKGVEWTDPKAQQPDRGYP